MSLPLRSRVEHASVRWVAILNRLPKLVVFLSVAVLLVVGLIVPRWGAIALLALAGFVGWLLFLTWPRLTTPEKLMRVAVLVLLLAVTATRAFPR